MNSSEAYFPNGQAASSGCNWRSRLGAYHDGELKPAVAAQIEKHLPGCDACRVELEELGELSALAGTIGAEGMSPFGLQRIHQAIDAEPRFSLLGIASILTGLAASVLIVGMAWLSEGSNAPSAAPQKIVIDATSPGQSWMNVASSGRVLRPPLEPWQARDQQMVADARFSSWMVEGLTERQP